MLISQALAWAEEALTGSGTTSPRLDTEVLLAEILGRGRAFLYSHSEHALSPGEKTCLQAWIRRRSQGLPVAYILGRKEFWALEFQVTPAVLIPRPETELLVEIALERIQESGARVVVEVGCGSGAVVVSLAKEIEEVRFYATDNSPAALRLARENAKRHGMEGRISFLRGDLLGPLSGLGLEGRIDQIVSNPPYIPRDEIARLQGDIRLYEPNRALDGGVDGLSVYRRLIPQAFQFLEPGGWLILEMGKGQGWFLSGLLARGGGFGEITTDEDFQGIQRVISARRMRA